MIPAEDSLGNGHSVAGHALPGIQAPLKLLTAAEIDHVRIRTLPLLLLCPALENERVYRPVSTNDPEVIDLAGSIRQHGQLEDLVVTEDNVILSGHRRHAALKLAGRTTARCRVLPIDSDDPRFMVLLREFNRQRTKTVDEVLREEIVSSSPDEAYADLLQYRQQAARVKVQTGIIEGCKRRSTITEAKRPLLDTMLEIVNRFRDYWPLSDRLIHYQLLNSPPLIHARKPHSRYRNDQKSYKAATELLTRARIAGAIPFEAISDPTRPVTTWDTFRSAGPYICRELDNLLKGYFRDLQASQDFHLEILGEKNTVAGIIRPVAADYVIPFTLGRGYSSLPPRHDMAQRWKRSGKDKLILLVLSDFDPEGEDIAHSFARSMRDEFGVKKIDFIKVALTASQVDELHLPPGPKAKKGSSRRRKFVEEHGEHVYELEAVDPNQLQTMLRQTIESVLDMDRFRAEQAKEREDAAYLDGVRRRVIAQLGTFAGMDSTPPQPKSDMVDSGDGDGDGESNTAP